MGNIGKTAKITVFNSLNPVNSGFGANFAPYPQEGDARDFLGKIWKVKIFVPGRGGPIKGPKLAFFGHFWAWWIKFWLQKTSNIISDVEMVLWAREKHSRKTFEAFLRTFCYNFFRYCNNLNLRFWPISGSEPIFWPLNPIFNTFDHVLSHWPWKKVITS